MHPQVVVFSDYICPFCYIGKVAIDQLQREFAVPVEWRHIEIHPETPLEGIPRARLGVGYYSQAWLHVERMAAERGIEMRPSPMIANSSFALIATEYARLMDRFIPFHEAVFRAYWLDGQNIGELRVLLALAQQVGLDPAGLKTYFQDGNWEQALEAQQRSAAANHVSGVPTVVIGDEVIVGAQPYDVLRDAVLKARGAVPRGHQPALLDLQTTAKPYAKERADPTATQGSSAPLTRPPPVAGGLTLRPKKVKAASVDEYVALLGPQARALTQRLRVLVRKALPEAVEVIKWGNPVYIVNGKNVAWILNYRDHLDLGFFAGAKLHSKLLEGTGKGLRHIKVRTAADIHETEFATLLRAAAELAK